MATRSGLTLGGIAVVALAAAALAQGSRVAIGSAFVVGQVVDAVSGRPIAGASVTIRGVPATTSPAIITGGDGYFLFRDLPAGQFTVSANKSGYVVGNAGQRRPTGSWRPLAVADGQGLGPVQVRLWRTGALTGTVVDDTGEPVVAAEVRVLRRARRAGVRTLVAAGTALSDDRGAFRFGALAPGQYTVMLPARRAGALGTLAREAEGWSRGFMRPTLDRVMAPVGGEPESSPTAPVYPTTFHPDALEPGQAQFIDVTPGTDLAGVDLRLVAGAAFPVSGRVIGDDGPARDLPVRLVPDSLETAATLEPDFLTVTTGLDGDFLFPFVPSGLYRLRAGPRSTRRQAAGVAGSPYAWAEASLSVGQQAVRDLVVNLQAGLRIRGRLAFEGPAPAAAPAPDPARIAIAIENADPAADNRQALESLRPDAGGEFVSAERPPGRYFVRVTSSPEGWMFKATYARGIDVSDRPLDLLFADEENVTVTFTSRWTGLSGNVRDPAGAPDAAASILLFPMNTLQWEGPDYSPRRLRNTLAREDGSWTLTSVMPGDYYLVAIPETQSADWNDPDSLLGLMRGATQVSIHEGEQRTFELRTQPVR